MLKRKIVCLLLIIITFSLVGCAKVRFTTGLSKTEFAKYGDNKISTDTAKILMGEIKYSYENIFNNNVWNETVKDVSVEDYVVSSIKETIKNLIFMDIIGKNMQITLTADENVKIKAAAEKYVSSLTDDKYKKSFYTVENIAEIYKMFLLAEKTFYAITDEVDTEVSMDEARTILVQYVFKSTKTINENGEIVEATDSDKKIKENQIKALHTEIENGIDIISVAVNNSDDSVYSIEIGRGQYDEDFENAAFSLEMGEVSGVVNTKNGYYIIKCINDNIDNNIEQRKKEIVLERRKKVFLEYYNDFINEKNIQFNNKFLSKNSISGILSGNGNLYQIYNEYFVSTHIS